ncbi:hypothetical protein BD779DRAFT_1675085 [Infundibulicybe gibba]|nr:hypothetical protein BD779DRAFT_1675085 [Infundibulicybe gibba]
MSLLDFPEELLDRILAHVVISPSTPNPANRPAWHPKRQSTARLAPLLASRRLHRLSIPHLYSTPVIASPAQAKALSAALSAHPEYARCIRGLTFHGVWPDAAPIIRACTRLRALELWIDDGDSDSSFCDALIETPTLARTLTQFSVFKPQSAYLTLPRVRHTLARVSHAITQWHHLESATIGFKITEDILTKDDEEAITLPAALASCPRLHTITTPLPSLWNTALLRIAQANTALQRIVFCDVTSAPMVTIPSGPCRAYTLPHIGPSIAHKSPAYKAEAETEVNVYPPPGRALNLYLIAARKYPRLTELIIRGGRIPPRIRAQTMGPPSTSPSPAAMCTPLPASPV